MKRTISLTVVLVLLAVAALADGNDVSSDSSPSLWQILLFCKKVFFTSLNNNIFQCFGCLSFIVFGRATVRGLILPEAKEGQDQVNFTWRILLSLLLTMPCIYSMYLDYSWLHQFVAFAFIFILFLMLMAMGGEVIAELAAQSKHKETQTA